MYWYLILILLCLSLTALLLSYWLTRQQPVLDAAQSPAKDELTSTMVHDLRSPISNTLAALTMLREDGDNQLSPDGQLLLDLTVTNTEKALEFVNQILELNELEQIGLTPQTTAVSLPELLQTVLVRHQPLAASRAIALEMQVPDHLPTAWADSLLLERVLQNLVDNALKASPPQSCVKLLAGVQDEQLVVSVADEGAGVPTELENSLFEKFSRGRADGSGLGLAFCQMALQAHQQTIWYEKNGAGGATFSFTLPTTPLD